MPFDDEFYTDFLDETIGEVEDALLLPLANTLARGVRQKIVDKMERAAPRTGRQYFIPGTKTLYTASAPGEPPAVREGSYRDAWVVIPAVKTRDGVRALVVNDRMVRGRSLARMLERGAGRMRPRPHIRPALLGFRLEARALVRRFTGR